VDIDALSTGLVAAVESHAQGLGLFDAVNGHEPIGSAAPGNGITFAVWYDAIDPAPLDSGLAAGSGLITMTGRLYTPANQQPYDAIDPAVWSATVKLMAALALDFDLGGLVRNIDLLGAFGPGLSAKAGYVTTTADNTQLRVMTVTIPCIVNDLWPQAAT